ncbi:endolytic transglycosylase MltG [Colwellia sp. D2M02]|uniref:endolytic transglycosylase MltG n=1 Tax=Colwellia sp. D2M02 TaxID=2841562 RepID=UPI001C09C700|nr:endolytic transglycosylase MltG [Colwellia sp. D2M02]
MLRKIILVVLLLGLSALVIVSFNIKQAMQQSLPLSTPQLLTVVKGSSVNSFSKQLISLGWLNNSFYLKSYVKIFPQYAHIKAGTYQVTPQTNLQELLALLVSGKEHQFTITFIEGSTFKENLALLKADAHITQTLNGQAITDIAQLLNIEHENPEGWIFPDTYAFTSGTTDVALLTRAYKKMVKQLNRLWQTRAQGLPYQSAYEVLIMASIIEKETSHIPEQPIISGVFLNRLRKNMRLQTDPTVIYGLGDRYQGDITYAHLREKTAYNTYRINGLPPTPIALPGLTALQATVNPAATDYYYFVSQGNGQHTFSRTLSEHNKAVKRYIEQQALKNKN